MKIVTYLILALLITACVGKPDEPKSEKTEINIQQNQSLERIYMTELKINELTAQKIRSIDKKYTNNIKRLQSSKLQDKERRININRIRRKSELTEILGEKMYAEKIAIDKAYSKANK